MNSPSKLGILAGAGALPRLILVEMARQGRPVFTVAFQGHTDPATVANTPHLWTRLGRAGAVIRALKREGVKDVVMAGAIRRPSLAELRPDWYAARFYMRLGRAALGDDGLLRALARLLEGEGLRVVGAADLIAAPFVEEGVLGSVHPTPSQRADIDRGVAVVRTLAPLDIGQAVAIQDNVVLAVEGAEGTDAMIARCKTLARKGSRPVLVKLPKPQQDMRLDLPTIGAATIEALASAGFAGVAVEAKRTVLLDVPAIVAAADRHGLFIVAMPPPP